MWQVAPDWLCIASIYCPQHFAISMLVSTVAQVWKPSTLWWRFIFHLCSDLLSWAFVSPYQGRIQFEASEFQCSSVKSTGCLAIQELYPKFKSIDSGVNPRIYYFISSEHGVLVVRWSGGAADQFSADYLPGSNVSEKFSAPQKFKFWIWKFQK